MITIKKNNVLVDRSHLKSFQQAYIDQHIFVLPQFLCPSLQTFLNSFLINAKWYIKQDAYKIASNKLIAKEFALDLDNRLYKILSFYLNHPIVIETVRSITNQSEIKSFNGRIYKFENDENCYDSWHNDMTDDISKNRLIGLSLNLSEQPYIGGTFKLRNRKTKLIYKEITHKNWGGGHFFEISPV